MLWISGCSLRLLSHRLDHRLDPGADKRRSDPSDSRQRGATEARGTQDQPGTKLAYREGYYARDVAPVAPPTPEQFKAALQPGAPANRSVLFTARITKSSDRANVAYGVEPDTVDFQTDPSGQLSIDIDFAILEYDEKGKPLDKSLVRLSGKMTPQQRARLTAKTLSTKQDIALKPGARTLVLGVRDKVSGRFGSLETSLPMR